MIGVIEWVLDHSEATGGARLVLIVLAEHAHADGGEAFPSVDTIAHRTRMSRRGVQESLRRLEAEGHIVSDGVSRKGTKVYRVLMSEQGGADRAPRADRAPAQNDAEGGAPRAPEPSVEPSGPNGESSARAKAPEDVVPDDFPAELRPHARRVMAVLRDVAARRGARKVTARAVGLTVMARPRKPLVMAAHDCAAWIEDHPEVACRDVVARYRRWLDREPDLQGLERLADDGTPTGAPARPLAGVHPIRSASGVRLSAGERLEERTAIRRAEFERLGGKL
jgi:hypothetical protein